MKILITGSSGFIGFHLVSELLRLGHQVVGIDNHSKDFEIKLHRNKLLQNENFTFHMLDLNDDLSDISGEYDLAINLAAQAGVRLEPSQFNLYEHSNINGFKNFCGFCKKHNIKKIIFASSSSVYSDNSQNKFSENSTLLSPKSYYGQTKLMNEEFSKSFFENFDNQIIGLRFFSVYGPFGRPDMAYYSFAKNLLEGKPITLNNDGNMARDMTYISDIINGIILSIDYLNNTKVKTNEIFNLGNDKPIKTLHLLETLQKKLNKRSSIMHTKTYYESKFTHADISKSKSILGYSPETSFEEGIDLFLMWFLSYHNKT